jgi:cytochrome c oxidase subunit 3
MTTLSAHKSAQSRESQADRHEAHGQEHPLHLAHHWDSLPQQFEAGKLGMWLFLATEVLLFGGLFCAYSIWRGNHPELFKYGSHFLNTTLGATNTAVLILSSLTMAWGVTAAQQNKQGLLKLMLFLTLCGAAAFLIIKYFEYKHKFDQGWYPGLKFYAPPPKSEHSMFWHAEVVPPKTGGVTAPHAAAPAVPLTPLSTENPSAVSQQVPQAMSHTSGVTPGAPPAQAQTVAVTSVGAVPLPPADAPAIGPAPAGPKGLNPQAPLVEEPFKFQQRHHEATIHPLHDPDRPPNTHMFFNIYFMMTGLHGLHVLAGMIVISWLLIRAFKGHFHSEYFTPVDLGGLYWHVVDLIWIFLFPLFYLI